VLPSLSVANQKVLTGRQFFPDLISAPFHHGLVIVFVVAAGMSVLAAVASLLRGGLPATPNPTKESADITVHR
jgi:hypothetical protein